MQVRTVQRDLLDHQLLVFGERLPVDRDGDLWNRGQWLTVGGGQLDVFDANTAEQVGVEELVGVREVAAVPLFVAVG